MRKDQDVTLQKIGEVDVRNRDEKLLRKCNLIRINCSLKKPQETWRRRRLQRKRLSKKKVLAQKDKWSPRVKLISSCYKRSKTQQQFDFFFKLLSLLHCILWRRFIDTYWLGPYLRTQYGMFWFQLAPTDGTFITQGCIIWYGEIKLLKR